MIPSASASLASALDAHERSAPTCPGSRVGRHGRQQRAGELVEAAYILENVSLLLLEFFEPEFLEQAANHDLYARIASAGAVITGAGARAFRLIGAEEEPARLPIFANAASSHARAFHKLLCFLHAMRPLKEELAALRATTFSREVVLSCLKQLLLQPRLGMLEGACCAGCTAMVPPVAAADACHAGT